MTNHLLNSNPDWTPLISKRMTRCVFERLVKEAQITFDTKANCNKVYKAVADALEETAATRFEKERDIPTLTKGGEVRNCSPNACQSFPALVSNSSTLRGLHL